MTFDVGGSPECVDNTCGQVIEIDDIPSMQNAIESICQEHLYSVESCRERASEFDRLNMLSSYINLYRSLRNS